MDTGVSRSANKDDDDMAEDDDWCELDETDVLQADLAQDGMEVVKLSEPTADLCKTKQRLTLTERSASTASNCKKKTLEAKTKCINCGRT